MRAGAREKADGEEETEMMGGRKEERIPGVVAVRPLQPPAPSPHHPFSPLTLHPVTAELLRTRGTNVLHSTDSME